VSRPQLGAAASRQGLGCRQGHGTKRKNFTQADDAELPRIPNSSIAYGHNDLNDKAFTTRDSYLRISFVLSDCNEFPKRRNGGGSEGGFLPERLGLVDKIFGWVILGHRKRLGHHWAGSSGKMTSCGVSFVLMQSRALIESLSYFCYLVLAVLSMYYFYRM